MSSTIPSLKILVAEDDPNLGEALVGFLREKNHAVDLARDGGEALRLLSRKPYALVLTDLVMPEADGLTVLRAARQQDPATLVVIMTGHASLESAVQATREGAYDYLRKPFNLQELDVAVANAARLLHLKEENGRLLTKLNELTAKLEALKEDQKFPENLPPTGGQARGPQPLSSFPWLFPLPWETEHHHQVDLDRLLGLYKENLLTEREFQILKQRLLI
jgi:DNA-binding response OmpR family regulator